MVFHLYLYIMIFGIVIRNGFNQCFKNRISDLGAKLMVELD